MRKLALVLAGILLLPAAAFAQSSIAGIVKDTSGAVLPGVTVEAASEALIERVRSSVTDVRTFSMSASLAASTVTPGRTAPEVSLTMPAIDD